MNKRKQRTERLEAQVKERELLAEATEAIWDYHFARMLERVVVVRGKEISVKIHTG